MLQLQAGDTGRGSGALPFVNLIADYGVADVRAVNTQLMRAPGQRFEFQQGVAGKSLSDGEAGLRRVARVHHLPARPVVRAAPDWRVNLAALSRHDAANQRQIAFT